MHKFKKLIGLVVVLMLALMIGAGMLPSFAGGEPEESSHDTPADAAEPTEERGWNIGELRDWGPQAAL